MANARMRLNELCLPRGLAVPKPQFMSSGPQEPYTCQLIVPGTDPPVVVTARGRTRSGFPSVMSGLVVVI